MEIEKFQKCSKKFDSCATNNFLFYGSREISRDQKAAFIIRSNKYYIHRYTQIQKYLNLIQFIYQQKICIHMSLSNSFLVEKITRQGVNNFQLLIKIMKILSIKVKICMLKLIHRDISSAYFFLIVDLRKRGTFLQQKNRLKKSQAQKS